MTCLLFVCTTLVLFMCTTLVVFVCTTLVVFMCTTLVVLLYTTLVLFMCSTLVLFSVHLRKRGGEDSPWTTASHWTFFHNAPFIYTSCAQGTASHCVEHRRHITMHCLWSPHYE